ncbi:MAG: NRDE family protein [Bacteroidetes bacterium]|nr:NRDE family protein [Bacteroidota bacterium]
MCTVTYIPTKNGVILTSNRDEHISRGIAFYPEFYQVNNRKLVFPKDSKAGGTWFISNEFGDTGILLNGAIEKHKPMLSYRKSRGLVLPDIFQSDSPLTALKNYNCNGIENFTIILWEQCVLREIQWDGEKLIMKLLDRGQAHIWSSVTLYNKLMIAERHNWFNNWLQQNPDMTQKNVLDFHGNTHAANKEYGLLISRKNRISTTSITSLCIEQKKVQFRHKDLLQDVESMLQYDLMNIPHINLQSINESVQKN